MTRPFDAAYVIVQTLFVGDASEEMQITLLILLVVKLQQKKNTTLSRLTQLLLDLRRLEIKLS